jgi:cytidylate kinase
MIVTIDGPAGSGKSSAAKALAERLGFEFLDTGAMYRAVTLLLLRDGVDPADSDRLTPMLQHLDLKMPPNRVLLNDEDVTAMLRTSEVTAASGRVADNRDVRQALVERQRTIATGRDMVCEGRDQGTIVFPDATRKFFLVADATERARRRQRDLAQRGEIVTVQAVLQAQEERDRRDAARDIAPMRPASDAVVIDSTHLTLDQVVERMEREVRR